MRSGGPAANADPGGSNSARGVRKRGLGPSEFIGSASSSISKMSNVDMAELIPENLAHASILRRRLMRRTCHFVFDTVMAARAC